MGARIPHKRDQGKTGAARRFESPIASFGKGTPEGRRAEVFRESPVQKRTRLGGADDWGNRGHGFRPANATRG